MTQLDLFDSEAAANDMGAGVEDGAPPNGATILPFPQGRNIGKVRHVARYLLRRPEGRARDAYWGQICNRMTESMRRADLRDDVIHHQIQGFRDAVGMEMGRILADGQRRPEDGHERYF